MLSNDRQSQYEGFEDFATKPVECGEGEQSRGVQRFVLAMSWKDVELGRWQDRRPIAILVLRHFESVTRARLHTFTRERRFLGTFNSW